MESNILVTRDQMASYMGVGDTPVFHIIGEGFTDLSESKGAKEYTRKYVNKKTEQSDVIGYAPSISYSCDVYSQDLVIGEITKITDQELTGVSAHRDIVTVNLWKPGSTPGTFEAFKRTYAIIPDGKGSGAEALVYSGTMKAAGDMVPGSFDTATKTFTETV